MNWLWLLGLLLCGCAVSVTPISPKTTVVRQRVVKYVSRPPKPKPSPPPQPDVSASAIPPAVRQQYDPLYKKLDP